MICGAALEQCPLRPRPQQDADAHLSARIINYVQQNYTGSLTLEQMARDLGYNYTYLSAYFNQRLHTGFQDFVNQYRVSHAAMLLQGSSIPVTPGGGAVRLRHDPQLQPRIFKVIGHVAKRLPQAEPMKKALPGWGGPWCCRRVTAAGILQGCAGVCPARAAWSDARSCRNHRRGGGPR